MSDQTADGEIITAIKGIPLPTRSTRRAIVVATILFTWLTISGVLIWGSGDNSLHQSAISWSYTSMLMVIFAYVFGAVSDNYIVWKNAPKI